MLRSVAFARDILRATAILQCNGKSAMSKPKKPSIVFAHGLWADGSCFQKVVPVLQAEGHEVICSQHGLDSLKGDVECVTRCFGRVSSPWSLSATLTAEPSLRTRGRRTGSPPWSTSPPSHRTRPKPRKA